MPALVKMEALFSPFRGPPPHTDGREEPVQPLATNEPSTIVQTRVPAHPAATPENMSMLNTPDSGAMELDVMAHHDQVAPPASHINAFLPPKPANARTTKTRLHIIVSGRFLGLSPSTRHGASAECSNLDSRPRPPHP